MPFRTCITCNRIFDRDTTWTHRCPPCQARYGRDRRTTARGYGHAYQQARNAVVADAIATREPCAICGKPCLPGQKITAEHVIPRRDGGPSTRGNLKPAHSACNTAWNKRRRT